MNINVRLRSAPPIKLRFAAGATGPSGTIAAGTTTTGAPGTDAAVVNSGTSTAAVFDFTIPRGNTGTAATVAAGTTTTGSPGTDAAVVNSGSSSAAVFDFTIPRGNTGTAATIAVGTVTTGAPLSSATVTNVGTAGAAVFDFSIPRGSDGVSDGDKGDVTVSSTGSVWTIDNDVVTNAKAANMAVNTIKGRITSGTGDPEDLTAAQARTIIGQGWFAISDQTLVSNATAFTDIALGSCQFLRFNLIIRPNASAASDFQVLWRLSADGGSTFPSGASDYSNQSDTGAASSAGAASSSNSAGFLTANILKSSAIPGRVKGEFEKGTADYRASMQAWAYFFNGASTQVYDVGSSYSTLGAATHLRVLGDVTNCFGVGSRLIVEGLI